MARGKRRNPSKRHQDYMASLSPILPPKQTLNIQHTERNKVKKSVKIARGDHKRKPHSPLILDLEH